MPKTLFTRTLAAASLALLVAVALTTTACDNGGTTSPTGPAAVAVTDPPYTGTIALSNADFFVFTETQAGGEVDITFTAETPTTNPPILVELGTASADKTTCTPQTNTAQILQAVVNPTFPPFTTAAAGNFCLYLQDTFAQGPIGYTFTVTHH